MTAWIAVLAFVLVTGLAAGRLFLLFRETRCLPELLIAILIFGVGTVAVGTGFLIPRLLAPGPVQDLANFVPMIGAALGMLSLSVFTWRVYRPASPIARAVAGIFGAGSVTLVVIAATTRSVLILGNSPYLEIQSAINVSVMMWSAGEAILYWLPMRRRLALGLADPMVANRFLLWGIATGTAGLGIAIGAVARIFGDVDAGQASWISINYALHGMMSAIAFWFAFKPPQVYARWVRASTERPAS